MIHEIYFTFIDWISEIDWGNWSRHVHKMHQSNQVKHSLMKETWIGKSNENDDCKLKRFVWIWMIYSQLSEIIGVCEINLNFSMLGLECSNRNKNGTAISKAGSLAVNGVLQKTAMFWIVCHPITQSFPSFLTELCIKLHETLIIVILSSFCCELRLSIVRFPDKFKSCCFINCIINSKWHSEQRWVIQTHIHLQSHDIS